MPSNVDLETVAVAGVKAATKEVTHDGDTAHVQVMSLVGVSGGEGTYVIADINGDATNGLDVDVTRVIPGTTATALGKAEDAAHNSGDTGVLLLAVRRDVSAGSAGTDGDYATLAVASDGRLWTYATVDAALPAGTNNIGDVDVLTVPAPLNVVGGGVEAAALRVTLASDSTGVLSVNTELTTADLDTGAGTDTRAVAGLVFAASGGATLVSAAAGLPVEVVAALPAGDNNIGNVDVITLPALPAGTNNIGDVDVLTIAAGDNNIGNVDIVTMPNVTLAAGTNTNEVVGDAAHDAAIGGNPVRIGARALTADYTAVAAGDTADIIATLLGKLVTYPYANPNQSWVYAAASGGIVNTTGVSAKAAAGAGIRNYVTEAQIVNGHATVSTDVQIRDGASGTVLWRGFAQAAGGGISAKFDPPLRGTANTLIEVACGTTGTATYFNLQGFTAAE